MIDYDIFLHTQKEYLLILRLTFNNVLFFKKIKISVIFWVYIIDIGKWKISINMYLVPNIYIDWSFNVCVNIKIKIQYKIQKSDSFILISYIHNLRFIHIFISFCLPYIYCVKCLLTHQSTYQVFFFFPITHIICL